MASKKAEARRRRPDARNHLAPPGMHWCAMHNGGEGAYLPFDQFYKNKAKVHGLDDRCKACAREYRREHERRYGKRSDTTKTVRVTLAVHALITKVAKARGITHPEYLAAAVRFYVAHGCIRGKCTNVGLKRFGGICEQHWFAANMEEETA